MDCPKANPASPSSPWRTLGRRHAGLPPPGISASPRKRDPGSGAPCGHRNSGGLFRSIRRLFFLTPFKPDDSGSRVAKQPLDLGLRTKPRETVFVQQTPDSSHPAIVPDFLPSINKFSICNMAMLQHQTLNFYPLTSTMSLNSMPPHTILILQFNQLESSLSSKEHSTRRRGHEHC